MEIFCAVIAVWLSASQELELMCQLSRPGMTGRVHRIRYHDMVEYTSLVGWCSGIVHRMLDPQLRGLASCCVLKLGQLCSLSSLSCVNDYLAMDSGGYVNDQFSSINCSMAECFQGVGVTRFSRR